ncbi:UDP-3-O-(3-hydroxymyristoyl)glucosamine N-acyltransferase [bacterium]|nr:UDP-3-O-(3-hydroxymyristoyl)glucosamine N-acyltransferase [bacterium]
MKLPEVWRLEDIAQLLGCDFVGTPDFPVHGFNEIHRVEEGDIVFVDHPKYYEKALNSAATVVLINQEVEAPKGKALLLSDDPFRDFNKLHARFNPFRPFSESIAPTATIGEGTWVGPNVVIGDGVRIGRDCRIHPNVVLLPGTEIGDRVVIQASCVLGSDAFYYKKRPAGFDRLLSSGRVIIEDEVELGAGCTIDRGVTHDTRIGRGSKLDNQVQIGHDTVLGERCLLAAQVGVAGCVTIGHGVTLWGQVGITSGIEIGDKAVVLGQSGVTKSLEGGKTYFGSPASEARRMYRELASLRVLPEIIEQLDIEL